MDAVTLIPEQGHPLAIRAGAQFGGLCGLKHLLGCHSFIAALLAAHISSIVAFVFGAVE